MPLDQFQPCIDACNSCAEACDRCAAACLREKEVQKLARCISLDIDCAGICRLAVNYMSRESERIATICEACAEICDACAGECAKHVKMEHCRECAEACRRCAQECRRVASMGARSSPKEREERAPEH
jgi:hypothetical protein